MKKVKIFTLFLMFFCVVVSAQSSDKVTEMIEAKTVSLDDVAYFAASYFGVIDEKDSGAEALLELEKNTQYVKISNSEILSYDDFAYFCTQTWNIKGGLMLMATKSPRYAFKELQSMGYVSQSIFPNDMVDGIQALTIMTNCIEFSEENEILED